MKQLIGLKDTIIQLIHDEISKVSQTTKLYVVTGINTDSTVNIKDVTSKQSFDNISFVSHGLGNAKGQILLPDVGDIVYVSFIGGDLNNPVILGSMYDTFSQSPDNKMPISKNEYFISAKTNGSYIYIKSDGTVEIKTGSGLFKFNDDGTFTLGSYTFPSSDGSSGQVLKTNGSGVLSWQNDIDT